MLINLYNFFFQTAYINFFLFLQASTILALQYKFNATKNFIFFLIKWVFTIINSLIFIFKIFYIPKLTFKFNLFYLLFYFEICLIFLAYYLIFTSLFYLTWFTNNNNTVDFDEFFFFFDYIFIHYSFLQFNFTFVFYILPYDLNFLLDFNSPLNIFL